jgi:hypothetical protein
MSDSELLEPWRKCEARSPVMGLECGSPHKRDPWHRCCVSLPGHEAAEMSFVAWRDDRPEHVCPADGGITECPECGSDQVDALIADMTSASVPPELEDAVNAKIRELIERQKRRGQR